MIIPSARRRLHNRFVSVPAWVLAPLSANNGCSLHCAFERIKGRQSARDTIPRYREVIFTSLPPKLWPDLWRLEIETRDKPGILFYLCQVLAEAGIEILAAEGSNNTFGQKHTMSFILSCAEYESLRDRDIEWRIYNEDARLLGLQQQLLLNFVDEITFSDAGFPRIKLKRLNVYRRLHLDHASGRRNIVSGLCVNDHQVELPDTFIKTLPASNGHSLFYTTAADTKERCARVLVFSNAVQPPGHAQFYIPRNHTKVLERLFHLLVEFNCNILRFQLRPGDNVDVDELLTAASEGRPSRLDFTYECRSADRTAQSVLDEIRARTEQEALFVDAGVVFLKSHSETMALPGAPNGSEVQAQGASHPGS